MGRGLQSSHIQMAWNFPQHSIRMRATRQEGYCLPRVPRPAPPFQIFCQGSLSAKETLAEASLQMPAWIPIKDRKSQPEKPVEIYQFFSPQETETFERTNHLPNATHGNWPQWSGFLNRGTGFPGFYGIPVSIKSSQQEANETRKHTLCY